MKCILICNRTESPRLHKYVVENATSTPPVSTVKTGVICSELWLVLLCFCSQVRLYLTTETRCSAPQNDTPVVRVIINL